MTYRIFGTTECVYCDRAKALLQMRHQEYLFINIEDPACREALEAKLPDWNRKVPQIFLNDAHIGGYTELQQELN